MAACLADGGAGLLLGALFGLNAALLHHLEGLVGLKVADALVPLHDVLAVQSSGDKGEEPQDIRHDDVQAGMLGLPSAVHMKLTPQNTLRAAKCAAETHVHQGHGHGEGEEHDEAQLRVHAGVEDQGKEVEHVILITCVGEKDIICMLVVQSGHIPTIEEEADEQHHQDKPRHHKYLQEAGCLEVLFGGVKVHEPTECQIHGPGAVVCHGRRTLPIHQAWVYSKNALLGMKADAAKGTEHQEANTERPKVLTHRLGILGSETPLKVRIMETQRERPHGALGVCIVMQLSAEAVELLKLLASRPRRPRRHSTHREPPEEGEGEDDHTLGAAT
mmetsp:Transcript_9661/g.27207  ORF Transcript_9661/g.27207 Transcript_9661/m.27207 type:complete len:331 (+) Transcript_9661:1591-2583(+)